MTVPGTRPGWPPGLVIIANLREFVRYRDARVAQAAFAPPKGV